MNVVTDPKPPETDAVTSTSAEQDAAATGVLTIDLDAQLAASNALAGRRGAVVAIDPDNGEVLAFTSTPGYDPNAISAGLSRRAYLALQEDIDRPLFDRALRGQYPPGSTIKPFTVSAALAAGVIRPDQVFDVAGNDPKPAEPKPTSRSRAASYAMQKSVPEIGPRVAVCCRQV